MIKLHTAAMAAAFATAAIIAPEAHATLTINAGGSVGAGGVISGGTIEGTDTTNTFAAAGPVSIGGFNINMLSITGVNAFGGNGTLMDVGALDISTGGSGTLDLFFVETNLTDHDPISLIANFTANTSNISVTRTLYFDPTNTGSESDLVLTTTGANGAVTSPPLEYDGQFALVEEIVLTATGPGATLSADDRVSAPEPITLGLFGGGLLGFGLLRRRRRS